MADRTEIAFFESSAPIFSGVRRQSGDRGGRVECFGFRDPDRACVVEPKAERFAALRKSIARSSGRRPCSRASRRRRATVSPLEIRGEITSRKGPAAIAMVFTKLGRLPSVTAQPQPAIPPRTHEPDADGLKGWVGGLETWM